MNTMARKYDGLLRTTDWQYYPVSADLSLFERDRGRQFIIEYLGKKGGKMEAPIFNYLECLSEGRIRHILSCFLLGILVYEDNPFLRNYVDEFIGKLPKSRTESSEDRFLYLWMLVSIFHDFGYAVEDGNKIITTEKVSELIKRMPAKPKGVPRLYSKDLLKKYNKYKCCRFNSFDHGVVGGVVLYTDLCDLRKKKKEENPDTHYWGEELEKDFSVAAWAIACHNIFYAKEVFDVDCYKRMGMRSLINPEGIKKISIKNHPIFYLLCLIDSIEPLKTFNDFNVLDKILINIEQNQITLMIDAIPSTIGSCTCKSVPCPIRTAEYFRKASSLNDWLTDTEYKDNLLTIRLNAK